LQRPEPPRVLTIGARARQAVAASAPDPSRIRHASDVEQARPAVAERWADVLVVDDSTTATGLSDLLGDDPRPVLEVVPSYDTVRTTAPFVEVALVCTPGHVLWRRIARCHEASVLRRQAERRGRLEATSSLMAGLAHEIRNPVHALSQGLEALKGRLPADLETSTARLVGVMEDAASRLSHLARDVQPIGALGSGAPRVTWDPAQSIAAALAILEHRRNGIEARVDVALGPGAHGRPDELDQVVLNLVDNALRAAGPGGWIAITGHYDPQSLEILVQDSGPGVPEGLRGEIFEPFVTTYRGRGGTGLGLHLCRQVVDGHDGTLTLRSEPGRGATFVLRLPTQALAATGGAL